ncbi:protein transport protein SEC16A homolog isoform X2 [Aristolochia californica]|uniref:protein transport protein SEC16A homolog isoform X2 n=1 Tax=Aristolochia californica TaxID=171875 RepID=UPI0035DFEACA
MATPPFQVEDQTDKDFFDKLVDDDLGITESQKSSTEGIIETDGAKAFANLSIGDMGSILEDASEEDPSKIVAPPSEVPERDILVSEESISFVSPSPVAVDTVIESNDSSAKPETVSDSDTSRSGGSLTTNIKEVQWSSFYTDRSQQDNNASGSFSDFFSSLPESLVDELKGNEEPITETTEKPIPNSTTSYVYFDQNTQADGERVAHTTDGQDAFNSEYWESHYPGWRYDAITGQWHQIDGYNTTGTAEEDFHDKTLVGDGFVSSNQQTEVSYLQQTAQSVVGTIVDSATTASVSDWNQASQGANEYPAHMVFDPQYPGWYYDTIVLEWRSLDSYISAVPTESTTNNHQMGVLDASSGAAYGEISQTEQYNSQGQDNQGHSGNWSDSTSHYGYSTWQPQPAVSSSTASVGNFYGSTVPTRSYEEHQMGFKPVESDSMYGQVSNGFGRNDSGTGFQNFASSDNTYRYSQQTIEQSQPKHFSPDYYGNQMSVSYSQEQYQSGTAARTSYTPVEGRSSAGRPLHTLVSFGFGGKLIVMKADCSYSSSSTYGSHQDSVGGSISILNLAEIVVDKTTVARPVHDECEYFSALCQQAFPGPLVGGNVAYKELNKWIDEKIAKSVFVNLDTRKAEHTRLLLSLLKISCQKYGKLRSPFGVDSSLLEADGPESDVTKLFASARRSAVTNCLQNLPSESQMRAAAIEVQNLLVSGRRKEALHCAVDGQLWNLALVLALQLGEQAYIDTLRQMSHRQLVPGSPLRTLFLLIAGQPGDVFSAITSVNAHLQGAVAPSQHSTQMYINGMLDDWEENLAVITANRTKGDELVIICLGDHLWRERGEIAAAHTCYLVAETNFESYSDSARLCLVGADHLKYPRTYVTPEAIQRTELFEYSKVLGNSQYILQPFQPYKFIYAHMLAEVGKLSDSLRYCQAMLKTLKNPGRAPEVETWKSLAASLEERIRTHQQGGYNTNLAPGKLVGKLFTSIDRSISRMIGVPPPVPSTSQNGVQGSERESHSAVPKVAMSQSTMAMSSLMPSASMEPISEWTGGDGSRMTMHNRSISEPDFATSQKQVDHSKETSSGGKAAIAGGPSRFGRLGSQLLQKTMGWVSRSRSDRQAKLGEKNKFYYDEKLKRWVEEGAEPPEDEAALPPPPTTTTFQNGASDYNINNAFKSQIQTSPANGALESKSANMSDHNPAIPRIPPANQFSARGRMGVRSRYVDTFNKGGGTPTNLFQSPTVPASKPVGSAKFFVPTPTTSAEVAPSDPPSESSQEISTHEDSSTSAAKERSFPSSSTPPMQRFPSMDNITPGVNKSLEPFRNGNGSLHSRSRAASWSGSYDMLKNNHSITEIKPLGGALGSPPSTMRSESSLRQNDASLRLNGGGSFGDDLQEVEL